MSQTEITADYVVIGAGAAAMAFTDTLLSETDATVVMVDRRARPGGHWNDAYSFVRLHSAAAFYGVNSAPLDRGRIDVVGWNKHHLELSSGAAICGYFDDVMRHRFLAGGRVTFLSSHDYEPDGTTVSRITGKRTRLHARRRVVDGTHADTRLPSTHPPAFPVDPTIRIVTPNDLPNLDRPTGDFVVIGGGKTAVDCVLWLLEREVAPEKIRWIRPRDSWFYNRKRLQPQGDVAEDMIEQYVLEMEAAMDAESLDDLFLQLEARKTLMRIDPGVTPAMFHCATVTEAELDQLRRVRNVIHAGRVQRIDRSQIVMAGGVVPTDTDNIHIHCAARGVPVRPSEPVFQDGRIVLQFLYQCWPLYSAALTAFLEAHRSDDAERNRLSAPVPMADKPIHWLTGKLRGTANEALWMAEPDVMAWRETARLDSFTRIFNEAENSGSPRMQDLFRRMAISGDPGLDRLRTLADGIS